MFEKESTISINMITENRLCKSHSQYCYAL